jgi:hypothetical protein
VVKIRLNEQGQEEEQVVVLSWWKGLPLIGRVWEEGFGFVWALMDFDDRSAFSLAVSYVPLERSFSQNLRQIHQSQSQVTVLSISPDDASTRAKRIYIYPHARGNNCNRMMKDRQTGMHAAVILYPRRPEYRDFVGISESTPTVNWKLDAIISPMILAYHIIIIWIILPFILGDIRVPSIYPLIFRDDSIAHSTLKSTEGCLWQLVGEESFEGLPILFSAASAILELKIHN